MWKSVWLGSSFLQLQFLDASSQPRYVLGSRAAERNSLVFIHGTLTGQDDTNLRILSEKQMSISLEAEV